jgi:hypothetical protein
LIGAVFGLAALGGAVGLTVGNAAPNVINSVEPADRADPEEVYDPTEDSASLPDGYRQLLDRDQIEPVYEPRFTDVEAVDWPDDSLVIGVAGEEDSKAYPVTLLNSREMVIDDIEGIPILVSW